MSTICVACPACGGKEINTRIVSLIVARCTCLLCRHTWTVPVERGTD